MQRGGYGHHVLAMVVVVVVVVVMAVVAGMVMEGLAGVMTQGGAHGQQHVDGVGMVGISEGQCSQWAQRRR